MTEEEIIEICAQAYDPGTGTIRLEGEFDADTLRLIADWMREQVSSAGTG